MEKSGKWLVVAMFLIALGLGGFSWWFRWSATHRAAEFWGPQAAKAIRDAEQVTAARIVNQDAGKSNELFRAEEFDASHAKGLVHLKQALLEDRSYSWIEEDSQGPFTPRWLLEFEAPSSSGSKSKVQVLFNDACTQFCFVRSSGRSSVVKSDEKLSSGMRTMFAEWFPDASD